MRPPAPDFLIPPAPTEELEQTPADTPLAREVRSALRGPIHALRAEFSEALADFEGRMCTALVEAVTRSKTVKDIHARLDRLEGHCFQTEPCPPPGE